MITHRHNPAYRLTHPLFLPLPLAAFFWFFRIRILRFYKGGYKVQTRGKERRFATLFLLVLLATLLLGGRGALAATKKNTLVKVKATAAEKAEGYTERYKYYDAKGKALKKDWATVKIDGKKEKMYFGKDGKAYQAPASYGFLNNVKTYKIGSATYGFDQKGRMVKGYVATAGFGSMAKFYFFKSNGKYNAATTKTYRKAIQTGLTKNINKLSKILGKAPSVKEVEVCLGADWTGELWTYSDLLQVQVKKNVNTGVKMIIAVSAAQEGL